MNETKRWSCTKCENQTALPAEYKFCPGCGAERVLCPDAEARGRREALADFLRTADVCGWLCQAAKSWLVDACGPAKGESAAAAEPPKPHPGGEVSASSVELTKVLCEIDRDTPKHRLTHGETNRLYDAEQADIGNATAALRAEVERLGRELELACEREATITDDLRAKLAEARAKAPIPREAKQMTARGTGEDVATRIVYVVDLSAEAAALLEGVEIHYSGEDAAATVRSGHEYPYEVTTTARRWIGAPVKPSPATREGGG